MNAKLILSIDGAVITDYLLNKDRITLRRHSHNDIVIDNLAVSGGHLRSLPYCMIPFLKIWTAPMGWK